MPGDPHDLGAREGQVQEREQGHVFLLAEHSLLQDYFRYHDVHCLQHPPICQKAQAEAASEHMSLLGFSCTARETGVHTTFTQVTCHIIYREPILVLNMSIQSIPNAS